ncbi:chitinase-3-like protein 2 [Ixodes scapularis]|uniref:chitinase-3-like protein 2 n=1 Tax=Ixodes scapularis TaxID=6945 RepID=UPI001A9F182F|nr:chitinase-3-like protein 2 [Ixodes scapularis]
MSSLAGSLQVPLLTGNLTALVHRPGKDERPRNQDYAVGTMTMLFLAAYYKAYQELYRHYKKNVKAYRHPFDRQYRYNEMKRVCYYLLNEPQLSPEAVDVSLCTHLVAGALAVSPDGRLVPRRHGHDALIGRLAARAGLKVLVSVGAHGPGALSHVVASRHARLRFIRSAVCLVRRHKLSGLDLDWEFPGWYSGHVHDRFFFKVLVQEFRDYMNDTDKEFLLTASVSGLPAVILTSYEVRALARKLDFVNLMAYDLNFFSPHSPFTQHHSPLFHKHRDTLTVASAVQHWAELGMPPEKMVLGIPLYARTFRLAHRRHHGWGSRALGPGLGRGFLPFNQVCKFLKKGAVEVMDKEAHAPYASKGRDWISYDSVQSAVFKSLWAEAMGLGGVMPYALQWDDWQGHCDNETRFPIHRAIWKAIG